MFAWLDSLSPSPLKISSASFHNLPLPLSPSPPLQEAKRYCAEIFEVLRTLKRTRDMSVAEIKVGGRESCGGAVASFEGLLGTKLGVCAQCAASM